MPDAQPQFLLSHKDLAALLVRENEIHEGLWEVAFEFQIAIGTMGPSPEQVCPGAMFNVHRVGLNKVSQQTALSIDAAVVNPAPDITRSTKPITKKAPPKRSTK